MSLPVVASAPLANPEDLEIPDKIVIQDNALKGIAPIENPATGFGLTENEIKSIIKKKYPEIASLLICMVKKESSFCRNLKGDKGKAYGCFQIHLDKHDITEECAMDFECSLDWTAKKIKEGKGYLWTSWKACLETGN
jgi:hypothetical protein